MSFSINSRIYPTELFYSFVKDPKTSDCTLITPSGKRIFTHKIFLAKFSNYFREIFAKNPLLDTINIPYDPSDFFEEFLNILIDFHFNANRENTFKIIDYAEYYGVSCLSLPTRTLIPKIYNGYSTFELCKLMIKANLIEDVIDKKEELAKELILAKPHKKAEMYKVLTPIVMYYILQTPEYKSKTQEQLFNIIDTFYSFHKDMTQKDKENFSSLIDFHSEGAYKFALQNDCDWVDPHIMRTLYSEIITKRRDSLNSFSQNIDSAISNCNGSNKFTRLFPFQFVSYVSACKNYNPVEPVPIVSMLSTMGYYRLKQVKLFKYGLLSCEPKIHVQKSYGLDNMFVEDKYFWGGQKDDESQSLIIGFDEKNKIKISSIVVDSNIVNKTTNNVRRAPTLQLFAPDSDTPLSKVSTNQDNFLTLVPDKVLITNKIRIQHIKSNPYDFCMRMNSIEIYGFILP